MKKKMKLLLALSLCIPPVLSVHATEFAQKESEYTEMCKKTETLSKSDIKKCEEFTSYLKEKNKEIENQILQTEQQLSNTLANINEVNLKIAQTNQMIESVQNEIQVLNSAIKQTTEEIAQKQTQLANRMYFIQSYINGNEYLYLLLKSNSIDELLTRIQNIDELTSYDKELITSLSKAKIQLEKNQEDANARYNDLFALQTQQNTLLLSLGQEAASYSSSLDEIRDTLAGTRVDIGFIDDSLTEAQKRIQAEEDRKKAEEEAKREEEAKKEEENKKPEDNNSSDNNTNQDSNESNDNNTSQDNPSSDNITSDDNQTNDSTSDNENPPADNNSSTSIANGIVATAQTKVGYPYVYGGTGPNSFDCSGFAQWVYKQNGIYIPRTVTSQYYACELVSNPQPGDLLFFNTTGYLGHVGIYIGGNLFIHAGTSSTGVCYGNLSYAYWQNCYQGAGRFR